jgi:hypothetical protein
MVCDVQPLLHIRHKSGGGAQAVLEATPPAPIPIGLVGQSRPYWLKVLRGPYTEAPVALQRVGDLSFSWLPNVLGSLLLFS